MQVVHRGRYMEFRRAVIERADGTRSERDLVWHPGAVAILARDPAGRLLFVRQWRVAADRALLEIPAGTLDVHDGVVEDPDAASRRELEEETGYRAATWRKVSEFWTAPGFASELMHLYLAEDLTPADVDRLGPDEDEHLELERLTLAEALAKVDDGSIADAKSIVGLLWLARAEAAVPVARPISAPEDDPGAVRVEYRMGLAELIHATAAAMRLSRLTSIMGLVFVLIAGLSVASGDWLAAVWFGLIGTAFFTGYFCLPFTWWAVRKRPDLLTGPMAFSADQRALHFRGAFGESELDWAAIKRFRRAAGFVFLDTGAGQSFVLPERAFVGDARVRLERLLVAHGKHLSG